MGEEAGEVTQYLAQQTQILASLHWLSSSQVLASIPLGQTVAVQDVADVSGVPFQQLLRLIRMTATAGILQEPEPELVKHTALSAQFVKRPFLSDALAFLADTALPTALQMGAPLRHRTQTPNTKQSDSDLDIQSGRSLTMKCESNPRLKRQMAAYHRMRENLFDDSVTEILSRLDWRSLGDATVVQVGARSTASARALLAQHAGLKFIIQTVDKNSPNLADPVDARISIQFRARGQSQAIKTAQVFILYLPLASLYNSQEEMLAEIAAEIEAHFEILRDDSFAKLLLVAELLPDPDKVENKTETAARSHDLFLMQLTNGGLINMVQLQAVLSSVGDDSGHIVIMNQKHSREGSIVVLQVKFESVQWNHNQKGSDA